jgi:uncharacterized protein (DUF1800 family)
MRSRLFRPAVFSVLALGLCVSAVYGRKKEKNSVSSVDERKRALHALNRLTFGPRPGDVDRVVAMGVDKWIELQLHPEKIDDSAVEGRISPYRTLHMSTKEMVENFPPPQLIRAVAEGKERMPSDPTLRAVYQAQIERYEKREANKNAEANGGGDASSMMSDAERSKRQEDRLYADVQAEKIAALPPDERMQAIMKMPPQDLESMVHNMRPDERQQILQGLSPQQHETLMAMQNPQRVVEEELQDGKLLRAIYSERQLEEVMTDFWFNHFNVFLGKGADHYFVTAYEREVIRPHALGKFKDLLVATAKSPAMLFYLDNWLSEGPHSEAALGVPKHAANPRPRVGPRGRVYFPPPNRRRNPNPQNAKAKQGRGLNENYGRELMELHTLGVNGGYTQKDVTEVARILTGWTLDKPREGGDFKFDPRMHEPGEKLVLGKKFKDDGEKEGMKVLEMLAHHPSTAKFICTKLAQRFVSDNPPPQLVERMAQTFHKKDGDIREVLRTMFNSPEFWAPEAYRAKVKTPLEFVVSSVRATGADVSNAEPLIQTLNRMGMPLYGMQPPTGYSMKAETWVNSAALLSRMNFAITLANGRIRGVQVDPAHLEASANVSNAASAAVSGDASSPDAAARRDAEQVLVALENNLLEGDVSKQTHETILKQLQDPQVSHRRLDDPPRTPNVGAIAGLILGSPEFQRR